MSTGLRTQTHDCRSSPAPALTEIVLVHNIGLSSRGDVAVACRPRAATRSR